jgi:hypothetical protein
MPIQVPLPQQTLRPIAGAIPLVPKQGQGALDIARGLGEVSSVAQNINHTQNLDAAAQAKQEQENQKAYAAAKAAAEKEQALIDVQEAEAQTQKDMRDQILNVKTRVGNAADGATGDMTAWSDQYQVKITQDMSDMARTIYQQRFGALNNSFLNEVAAHEAQQRGVAVSQSSLATIGAAKDLGASSYGNPDAIDEARKRIIEANQIHGKQIAADKTVIAFQTKNDLTDLHTRVFDNLAATNVDAAKAYFEKYKSEINGGSYDHFEKTIQIKDDLVPAQKLVDKLMTEHTTMDEKRQEVRNQLTGKQRENAMELIDKEDARFKEAQATQQKAVDDQAWRIFGETRNVSTLKSSAPAIYAGMSSNLIHVMEDLQKTSQERIMTDPATYLSLHDLAANDPTKFASTDLYQYANKLNMRELTELTGVQNKMATGATNGVTALINDIFAASEGMKDPVEKANFHIAVINRINAAQDISKAPLTPVQIQDIINTERAKTTTPGLLNKIPFIGQYFSGNQLPLDVRSIPLKEKQQIIEALAFKKIPATDDAIIAEYKKFHANDK